MCIPLVGRVHEPGAELATVELTDGELVQANVALHPTVEAGAWVLLDRGLIVAVIDEAEARKVLELYAEIEQLGAAEDAGP